jgi:chromate transporter
MPTFPDNEMAPPATAQPAGPPLAPDNVSGQPAHQASPLALFLAFLRLGLTAFGGPAMVAYIRELSVMQKRWLDDRCFQNGVALCQSIPGATAMQTAAYVGVRSAGFWGGLASYIGFGLPAFVFMTVLSAAYGQTRDMRLVNSAFHGLQVIVVALVANATLNFGRSSVKNWCDLLLAVSAAVFLMLHGSPIIAIIAAAGLGLLLYRRIEPHHADPPCADAVGQSRRAWPAFALCVLVLAGLTALWILDRRLGQLASVMLKVDLFAFGGGFASVPLMLNEVVDVRGWIDSRTFMDGIVLGQATPGPIVITATFVGYQVAGLIGAVVATISIFAPSFVVLVATVPYFDRLQQSANFRRAVRGALLSFVGLLLSTAIRFGIAATWSVPGVILAVLALVALRFKVDVAWIVLIGGIISAAAL